MSPPPIPRWRYALYGLLLAGVLAVALGSSLSSRGCSGDSRMQSWADADRPAGPGEVPANAPPTPAPLPVPFSGELFRKLTRAPWLDVECEREGKTDVDCWPWVFFPEGTYGRSAQPNALKTGRTDAHSKSWDVRATNDSSGIIATEEGNLMPFELQGEEQLSLAGRLYRRSGQPLDGAEPARPRDTHVSPLGILRGYEQLVSTRWVKVNPFDLDTQPDSITFLPEGRFKASYRQGSCLHEGLLHVESQKFFVEWGNNPCALGPRPASRFVSEEYPAWFLGELLFLKDAYRPEKAPAAPPQVLVGDLKWGLFLKGQFSTELRRGVPNELLLSLVSRVPAGNLGLGELWIWLREAPSQQGEPRPRKEQVLFSKNLDGQPLSRLLGSFAERIRVTPEFSGPAELEFELQLTNPPWAWRKRLHRVYSVQVGDPAPQAP
ncbi:hypothetical protein [Hyalangium versicolor]|uniref:hypothetical protein n=1 Tax=Hyalangium versicolor TaxID=2861190 RepID=UPI001CC9F1A8|nr:hypothetical protein [Hyalangium versicolor]